jgi:hypothetical protein
MFGGFDIQMLRVMSMLIQRGVDVSPLDFWSRDASFDLVHIWGLESQNKKLIEFSRLYNKKIVLSPLLPYVSNYEILKSKYRMIRGDEISKIEMLKNVDKLIVVNDQQLDSANKIYKVPINKISIIPTMLDQEVFLANQSSLDHLKYLCIGNICRRKNQLKLATLLQETSIQITFIGNVLGGEEAYTSEFKKIVEQSPNMKWIKWIDDFAYIQMLARAAGVIIMSQRECQPAAGLEAVALRKNLIMVNADFSGQKYFRNAIKVPEKITKESLIKLLENSFNTSSYVKEIQECNPINSVETYIKIYKECISVR